jgi:hypothetical protein
METIPVIRMADFEKGGYVSERRPCRITDGLAACEGLRRWTPEYLVTMYGDLPVDVWCTFERDSHNAPAAERKEPYRLANVPLREAARWITSAEPAERQFYVPQESVAKFPRLREDITYGRTLGQDAKSHLWFGTANTVGRLHADPSPNMFAQIHGRKEFMLFPPEQVRSLYPRQGMKHRRSQVDPVRPDLEAYPRFAEATPIVVTLNAGEILFLPTFWWHHVTSLSLSVSISQWWQTDLRAYCNPTGASVMTEEYVEDGWAETLRVRKLMLDDLLVFAEEAATMDQAMPALALGVVLDYFDRWPDHSRPMAPVEADVRQEVERLKRAVLDDTVYEIGRSTIAALARRVRHDSVLGSFANAYRPAFA